MGSLDDLQDLEQQEFVGMADEEIHCDSHNNNLIPPVEFVELLKKYPEVLNKSNKPHDNIIKVKSLERIQQELLNFHGKEVSVKAISKKINNMRSRLKTIMNDWEMGDKKGKLRTWDIEFLKLVNGDDEFCNYIEQETIQMTSDMEKEALKREKVRLRVQKHRKKLKLDQEAFTNQLKKDAERRKQERAKKKKELMADRSTKREGEAQVDFQSDDSARNTPELLLPELGNLIPPHPHTAKKQRICINEEMDETRNLSNDELQRLVLLEQLQLCRMNKETDETKNLNNNELQRLVLLEQLQVYRLKKEKLSLEIAQYNNIIIDTDD